MKTKDIFLIALGGGLLWWWWTRPDAGGPGSVSTPESRRGYLIKWLKLNSTDTEETKALVREAFRTMTDEEISAVYQYVRLYFSKGQKPPAESELAAQLRAISAKYNIFT